MPNFTNLSNLNTVTPINLTFDNLTSSTAAINMLKDTSQAQVGNVWFLGSIIVIFFILIWWFHRPDKSFLFDMTRSIMISSSWCLMISTGFLLSDWITTVIPIIWFATIFTITIVSLIRLKGKGL